MTARAVSGRERNGRQTCLSFDEIDDGIDPVLEGLETTQVESMAQPRPRPLGDHEAGLSQYPEISRSLKSRLLGSGRYLADAQALASGLGVAVRGAEFANDRQPVGARKGSEHPRKAVRAFLEIDARGSI